MNRTQSIALVRALAAVSWADGRLDRAEQGHLVSLAYRLGLGVDDLRRDVHPLLDHPLSYERALEVVGESIKLLGAAADRDLFLNEMKQLFAADGEVSDDEVRMLNEIETALAQFGPLDFMIGKLRSVWSGAFGRRQPAAVKGHQPYAQNKALGHLIERLRDAGIATDLAPTDLNRAALEGALLARIAAADDGRIDAAEIARIEAALAARALPAELRAVIVRILREGADTNMDRQRLCAEFNRVSTLEERKQLIADLYAVAGADPAEDVAHEIRLLANFFWIPTREFVQLRAAARRG